jgi:hypothetical protein
VDLAVTGQADQDCLAPDRAGWDWAGQADSELMASVGPVDPGSALTVSSAC